MTIPDDAIMELIKTKGKGFYKLRELYGLNVRENGGNSLFNYSKWKYLALCPYKISNKCCDVMKKSPAHSYQKRSGRKMMSGQMASESRLRTMHWMRNGCNGFHLKQPVSNPMAFWTEQDVLTYIRINKIPIASVYGEVVIDYSATGDIEGQMSFSDLGGEWELFDERPLLKTTGCSRTGCMFCGFGCHLDRKGEGRFERMKRTHPKQYDYIMRPTEEGGLNYKNVIDWINEHGDLNIKY